MKKKKTLLTADSYVVDLGVLLAANVASSCKKNQKKKKKKNSYSSAQTDADTWGWRTTPVKRLWGVKSVASTSIPEEI